MKIVQIMPEFGLAGAETMCENLTYELLKLGHEVVIISLYDFHSAITARMENAGVRMIYLNKKKGLHIGIISKIRKVIKEVEPDVIHTHRYAMIYSVPASLFLNIRKVHTVHNIAEKEVGKLYRYCYWLFYHVCGVTPVALSEQIRKTIVECYGIVERKIPIIYNGVDLSRCIPKKDYSIKRTMKIVNVARFSEQKNHVRLLESFSMLLEQKKEVELWLIGDGELKGHIKDIVIERDIDDKVMFLGIKDNVCPFLNEADVFVLSSDYEGMPMTLIEAMGTGLPVVTTNVGGIPDMIVNNHDGVLVERKADKLYEALLKIFKDESFREKIGTEAKKTSIKYSSEHMAKAYCKVYKEE